MSASQEQVTAKKDRSPSYPFISLKAAVERITAFDEKFKRHPAPADKAGMAWGLKETSSQAQQTLAALKSFGLVSYEGIGPKRSVKLTDDARDFLRVQQDSVKQQLLKKFALSPKPFAAYWEEWRTDRPIDEVCLDQLVLKGGYTPSAANTFLRVYDETMLFAGLGESHEVAPKKGDELDDQSHSGKPSAPTIPKVGDSIQWVSGEQEQFVEPRRVRALTESEGVTWLFVDGSETGIPASETVVVAVAANKFREPPVLPEVKVAQPSSAEREWLRGPLSKETSYRLFVSGDLGAKEIQKLIKVLEVQRMVLGDDD
nr:hypothetical protein [uncultured Pseudoxanthomonas sp.]